MNQPAWNIHLIVTPKKYVNLKLIGDVHIGADSTDEEAFIQTIDNIKKDSHAHVVLLGDLLELAMKPHMKREQNIPNHLQLDYFKELIRPIKNKIKFIFEGNHEKRVTKLVGLDYIKDGLKDFCTEAVFMGYEGFIQYSNIEWQHLLYLHHGTGGSTTTHYLLEKMNKIGIADIADAIIISHGHKRAVNEYVRWKIEGNTIVPRPIYGIRTGSYLGHAQYAKNAMFSAGLIKDMTLRLSNKMEVIW